MTPALTVAVEAESEPIIYEDTFRLSPRAEAACQAVEEAMQVRRDAIAAGLVGIMAYPPQSDTG